MPGTLPMRWRPRLNNLRPIADPAAARAPLRMPPPGPIPLTVRRTSRDILDLPTISLAAARSARRLARPPFRAVNAPRFAFARAFAFARLLAIYRRSVTFPESVVLLPYRIRYEVVQKCRSFPKKISRCYQQRDICEC